MRSFALALEAALNAGGAPGWRGRQAPAHLWGPACARASILWISRGRTALHQSADVGHNAVIFMSPLLLCSFTAGARDPCDTTLQSTDGCLYGPHAEMHMSCALSLCCRYNPTDIGKTAMLLQVCKTVHAILQYFCSGTHWTSSASCTSCSGG